jgi:hypothetical protein
MSGQFVIAIDVGIKNLGLCIFDFVSNQIVHWDCVTLVPNGRYIPQNNVQYVRNFVERYEHYFAAAQKVLIERQIRCNMRIVEAVLQTLFYEKCIVISARSVKVHYDLSTKNYRANKQKAVAWAQSFLQANPHAFASPASSNWQAKNKQDDLADSLLLIMYYLDTYSNQLTTNNIDVFFQGGFLL